MGTLLGEESSRCEASLVALGLTPRPLVLIAADGKVGGGAAVLAVAASQGKRRPVDTDLVLLENGPLGPNAGTELLDDERHRAGGMNLRLEVGTTCGSGLNSLSSGRCSL